MRGEGSLRFDGRREAVHKVQDSKPISILTVIVLGVQLGRKSASAGSRSATATDSTKPPLADEDASILFISNKCRHIMATQHQDVTSSCKD